MFYHMFSNSPRGFIRNMWWQNHVFSHLAGARIDPCGLLLCVIDEKRAPVGRHLHCPVGREAWEVREWPVLGNSVYLQILLNLVTLPEVSILGVGAAGEPVAAVVVEPCCLVVDEGWLVWPDWRRGTAPWNESNQILYKFYQILQQKSLTNSLQILADLQKYFEIL